MTEVSDEMVEAAVTEWSRPNDRRDPLSIMRAALTAALAVAPKPRVKALAEDALNLCEAGHPISAANLAHGILAALEDQS
jgi:hypothetical protein